MATSFGQRWMERLTRCASRTPGAWLLVGLVLLAGCWALALRLEIRGDFIELLPSDSAAARRYRSAVERMNSGGSSLVVVVRSADARQNQRFINALEAELAELAPGTLASVEHGPGGLRSYFSEYRWWFLEMSDLERLSCELEGAAARAIPGYVELEEPCVELGTEALRRELTVQSDGDRDVVYASYLSKEEDVVLSNLAATSTNELFEVAFGGIITVTAAFVFLGASATAASVATGSFGLGFATLPVVFAQMSPLGNAVGAIWFFILSVTATGSSGLGRSPGRGAVEGTQRRTR